MIRPLTACLTAAGIAVLALPAAPSTAAAPSPAPRLVHVQDVQQDVRRLPLVLPLPAPVPSAQPAAPARSPEPGAVSPRTRVERAPRPAPASAGVPVRTASPAAPAEPTATQLPQERIGRQIDCPNGTVGTQRADGTVDCPVAP